MNSCDTHYIVHGQVSPKMLNWASSIELLSWYQIKDSQDWLKYVTDPIQHVLCYTVLIQSHTPGFQIEIYNHIAVTKLKLAM